MSKERRISDEVAHAIVNLWKQPGVNLRDAVALVVEVNGKQVAVRWDALAADLLDLDADLAKTQHKLDVQRTAVEKAHRAFHEAPGMSGYHRPDDDVGDMMAKMVAALATARAAAQTLIAEVRRNHPSYEVPGRIVEFAEALDDALVAAPAPAPAQPHALALTPIQRAIDALHIAAARELLAEVAVTHREALEGLVELTMAAPAQPPAETRAGVAPQAGEGAIVAVPVEELRSLRMLAFRRHALSNGCDCDIAGGGPLPDPDCPEGVRLAAAVAPITNNAGE